MHRRRRAVLAVAALFAGACGGGSAGGGGPDPVAKAEDPSAVLVNSQYPELPVDGLKTSYLLDTGQHLTHVLSFVEGLRMDEKVRHRGSPPLRAVPAGGRPRRRG